MTTAPPPMRPMHTPGPRPGGAPAGGSAGGSTLDPLKLLKQYYPYLILASMIGFGLGIGLHFLLLKTMPTYTASVVFECMGSRASMAENRNELGRDEQERFVGTQVAVMMSETVLDPAMDQREIRDTTWAQPFLDEKKAINKVLAIQDLQDRLSARPLPQSNLIRLNMKARDAKDAMILANVVADAYMRDYRRNNAAASGEQLRVLKNQIKDLESAITKLKGEREDILRTAKLDSTNLDASAHKAKTDDLLRRRSEVIMSKNSVQSQYESYRQKQAANLTDHYPADLKEQAQQDHVVRQYDQKLASLRDSLGAMRKRGYGEKHDDIVAVKAQIEEAEAQKATTIETVLQRLWAAQVSQFENMMKSLDAQLREIEADLAQTNEDRQAATQAQIRVQTLDNDISVKTTQLAASQTKLAEVEGLNARENENGVTLSDRVRVISRATMPNGVSFPQLQIIVPGMTLLFAGMVGGFLFLREILDQRVRGPSDAAMVPRVKVLGIVPDASDDPSRPTAIETVFRDNPTGVLTESFRQMRAPIIQAMERSGHKSLVVLGCMPGSGATSVVTNMALAVAGAEERVLVVDANFRRPALHRVFKVSEGPGLGDILAGTANLDQAIQATSNDQLKVLTAGTAAGRSIPERLAGEAMSRLLLEASSRFDMIIVDVPPAIVSGDGYALANKCDASVVVCRAMVEKRGLLARVRNQIGESRAECLGVIVNAVRASAGGYFKRNIKATHAYQSNGKA